MVIPNWRYLKNETVTKSDCLVLARCGFLTYLRRDATALGLLLLSMLDITSSFLKDGNLHGAPTDDDSMAHFNSDVNSKKYLLRKL